jgi:hypothetical protein
MITDMYDLMFDMIETLYKNKDYLSLSTIDSVINYIKDLKDKSFGITGTEFFNKFIDDLVTFEDDENNLTVCSPDDGDKYITTSVPIINRYIFDIKKKAFFKIDSEFIEFNSSVAKTHANELMIFVRSLTLQSISTVYENSTDYGFSNLIVLNNDSLSMDKKATLALHQFVSEANFNKIRNKKESK